jgi:uncharacterized protein
VHELVMTVRDVEVERREVTGVVAPYDEVTYLVPDKGGERIVRGAFTRSIQHRGDKVPLFRDHHHDRQLGQSVSFTEEPAGLVGTFSVLGGPLGDELLEDFRHGYVQRFSVGFQPVQAPLGDDGVREVREARLVEVSAVGLPAYEGAGLLAVRSAQDLDELLAPFRVPRPDVDLSPIPPVWAR